MTKQFLYSGLAAVGGMTAVVASLFAPAPVKLLLLKFVLPVVGLGVLVALGRALWQAYKEKKIRWRMFLAPVVYLAGFLAFEAASYLIARYQPAKPAIVAQVDVKNAMPLYFDIKDLPKDGKKAGTGGGGGGGGDHDVLQAPKGRAPKRAKMQLAPPAVVIRNEHPKLEVEPTIIAPDIQLPNDNMPNLGDFTSKVVGPPSNGTGSGSGIGSGSGGGVGSGDGRGGGPGSDHGVGGGTPGLRGGFIGDMPHYTNEAQRAGIQANIQVALWINQDGKVINPATGQPVTTIAEARSVIAVLSAPNPDYGLIDRALESILKGKFVFPPSVFKDGRFHVKTKVNFDHQTK